MKKNVVSSTDTAEEDICPLCGKEVVDGQEWTLFNGSIAHEICAQEADPA